MFRPATTPAPVFVPEVFGPPAATALDPGAGSHGSEEASRAAVRTLCARAHAAALGHAATPLEGPAAGGGMADWNDLFGAVKARLRATVAGGTAQQARDPAAIVQARVLDCVEALDQLQAMLAQEVACRRQIDRELVTARMARERALAELGIAQADELRVRQLISHDSLTSLPSGAFFLERLDHALAYAEPQRRALAVLHLDLDGFRSINDAHGRATGDELLKIVAMRLTRAVRAEDMVSRIEADEFACMVAGIANREQLGHLACKLFDAVSAPLKIGKLRVTLHPSIGIAMCPDDGVTAEGLLGKAGEAMCRARRHLSGYSFCDRGAARR
ncbi:MAG TPA: GGDEF domain-containing protein [Ideonella sp.]|nr:GGDEF domain-containing protein [Ideonella sp.]